MLEESAMAACASSRRSSGSAAAALPRREPAAATSESMRDISTAMGVPEALPSRTFTASVPSTGKNTGLAKPAPLRRMISG